MQGLISRETSNQFSEFLHLNSAAQLAKTDNFNTRQISEAFKNYNLSVNNNNQTNYLKQLSTIYMK